MSQLILNQKNYFLVGFLMLVVAAALLLIGPRVPLSQQKQQCVVDLHIVGPFGVSLNCDSPEFMKDAVHPSLLLQKNSVRQSRPGMIFAAYLLSKPLFFLNKLADYMHPHVTRKDIAQSRITVLWQSGFAVYAAYLLLNIAILIVACYFYFKLAAIGDGLGTAAACLVLLFFVNPLTKTYLWSPHTQMFNIMGPLFLSFLLYRGFSRPITDRWWYMMTALASVLVTAYGTFLLYAPTLFFIFVYQFIKQNYQQNKALFYLSRLGYHALIFSVPTLVWYIVVKHVAGSYYVHEAVVYRQFVWMKDAWQHGVFTLLYQLGVNVVHTTWLIVDQSYMLLLGIAVLYFLLKRQSFQNWDRHKIVALCLAALMSALFVAFNGFVIARMASTAVPIIIVACGYLLECLFSIIDSKQRQLLSISCVLFVLIYAVSLLK